MESTCGADALSPCARRADRNVPTGPMKTSGVLHQTGSFKPCTLPRPAVERHKCERRVRRIAVVLRAAGDREGTPSIASRYMGTLTDPRSLKPSLGREGWCQRLLTELILDGPYPPYNSHRRPSRRGVMFLGGLDELSFGEDAVSTADPVFVDEIDFPARYPDEKGCAPDYTVFTEGRCWIIELKTEPRSHRASQIPDYFERGHHYHPGLRVDITYLTAGLRGAFHPRTEDWERFVHIEWNQITELIRSVWSSAADERVRAVASTLVAGINHLDEPARVWWSRLGYQLEPAIVEPMQRRAEASLTAALPNNGIPSVAMQEALVLAQDTAEDGHQRAIGLDVGGLEALHELRLELRRACRAESVDSSLRTVQPWLWSAATSGGTAMTAAGLRTGYEVRLSRTR